MGQPGTMASNGLQEQQLILQQQQQQQQQSQQQQHNNNLQQQQQQPVSSNANSGYGHAQQRVAAANAVGGAAGGGAANGATPKDRSYNNKAMEMIKNSLKPFKDEENNNVAVLVNKGFDEESSKLALQQCNGQLKDAYELLVLSTQKLSLQQQQQQQQHHQQQLQQHQLQQHHEHNLNLLRAGQQLQHQQHQQQQQQLQHPLPRKASEPNGLPPALPPRSHKVEQIPPRVPTHHNGDSMAPPPPPRKAMNPPPTPPRGSTPPPQQQVLGANASILRRMSPVPGRGVLANASPAPSVGPPTSVNNLNRGTSPVSTMSTNSSTSNYPHHPVRVQNSREIQQQVQQTLQSMSIFPTEGGAEPPPPYPMGTAAASGPPPPPSYSQSLAMRQSPTLSSTSSDYRTMSSSDYRRSPGLAGQAHLANSLLSSNYPVHHFGSLSNTPTPASPAPSPAYSMMSSSSRATNSSSMQAWSARQTKTHSPIIMQSVKSTQVQKPVLQTATPLAGGAAAGGSNPGSESNYPHLPIQPQQAQMLTAAVGKGVVTGIATPIDTASTASTATSGSGASSKSVPPPSYEFSIQQKHVQSTTPVNVPTSKPQLPLPPPSPNSAKSRSPTENQPGLPPPPPYPSTAVSNQQQQQQLVNGTSVSAKAVNPPVISTAKVVGVLGSNLVGKPPLQRRVSPAGNELTVGAAAAAAAATERSESPISDSHTVSGASPLSFMSNASSSTATATGHELTDSGLGPSSSSSMPPPPMPPPAYKTTHHTSPKPERKKKEGSRSLIRHCPPQAYKFYMEMRILNVIKEYKDRQSRRMRLERELQQFPLEPALIQNMRIVLQRKETNYLRMKRAKLNKRHFKKIKKIGVGAFGEVSLVRYTNSVNKKNGGLYAMKTLKKSHILEKNQVGHVMAEKDILAEADNDWIVKLYYSFQDEHNLYFVMEYIPGGDLMSLLIKKGTFTEDEARFYISELTMAVESVHTLGFIHRDIKPDNILIGARGHLKLTDFGLCTGFRWTHNTEYYKNKTNSAISHIRQDSMDPGTLDLELGKCSCSAISSAGMKPLERRARKQKQRCTAHSLVGTPNYIAPEVLLKTGYTQLCDWWSVGVILYEMIIGAPPFYAENAADTQRKIVNWEQYLRIPPHPRISPEAEDLIKGLCVSADRRLGRNKGSAEIKSHPFFRGIDFTKNLLTQPAPYKPDILHELDTSNFDAIGEDEEDFDSDDDGWDEDVEARKRSGKDYHGFYEFTFRRFFDDGGHPLPEDIPPSSVAGIRDSDEPPPPLPPPHAPHPDPVYV